MRAAVHGDAELIAVSYSAREDVSYGSDEDVEKACVQDVSGWMFNAFGLHPALGRLLTAQDDDRPAAHAYAVISYDYWSRRFGGDPDIIGRAFRMERTSMRSLASRNDRSPGRNLASSSTSSCRR